MVMVICVLVFCFPDEAEDPDAYRVYIYNLELYQGDFSVSKTVQQFSYRKEGRSKGEDCSHAKSV